MEQKNPLLAGLFNMLVPGSGYWYVDKDGGRFLKTAFVLDWEQQTIRCPNQVVLPFEPGGTVHFYNAEYWDIAPNERIVSSYEMHMDKQRISVSLATMEFKPSGSGTTFVLTEQGVFLDGYDDSGERERGTLELLAQLETYLNT